MAGRTRLISKLLLVGDRGTLHSMWGDGSCGGKLLTVARLLYPPHFIWIPAKLLLSRGPPHVFLFVRPRRACSTLFPFLSGSLKVEKEGGRRPSFPLPSLLFRPSLSLRLRDRSPRYDGDLSLSPSSPEFPLSPPLEGHSSQAPPFFLSSSSLLLSYDDVVESEGEGAKGRIQRVNQAPLQHSRCRQPTVFLLPPSQTVVEV